MNLLAQFGNIPVKSSSIGSLYPDIKAKNQKVYELEKAKEIIRLKKGLYVISSEVSGKTISTFLIANHIYGPSYISMQSALRYYGLIPESVYTLQSMTVKHSRNFKNTFGVFEYIYCNKDYFSIGITQIKKDNYCFLIATPEKALCDLILFTQRLNLRSKKEIITYLEEDIRLDMDAFYKMNTEILYQCAQIGKKKMVINVLIKLLMQ